MNKWYILSGNDEYIIGPFKSKSRAMLYMGWDSTTRDGAFFSRRGWLLGKMSDFSRSGFDQAFKSYRIETPKPLQVPGFGGW